MVSVVDGCFNLAIEFGPVHAAAHNRRMAHLWLFQSRNRVWAGSRVSATTDDRRLMQVSISQSSLGRFTLCSLAGHPPCIVVSISQSSLGRFTPVSSTAKAAARRWFQSRNRVWAGSRRVTPYPLFDPFRVSISQSSLGRFTPMCFKLKHKLVSSFNLAIEFGPVHAGVISGDGGAVVIVSISQSSLGRFTRCLGRSTRRSSTSFNLAIEFGPVHAMTWTTRGSGNACFNLAIEFGPVHASISACVQPSSLRFQSRNRVWAGSRFQMSQPTPRLIEVSISQSSLGRFTPLPGMGITPNFGVSISQSSLGRFTHFCCSRGSFDVARFNLAIEFGPVHAQRAGAGRGDLCRFQSRNRVWAGSRQIVPGLAARNLAVSISQSSLGRFTPGAATRSMS